MRQLRRLLASKDVVRIMEAHNGLSGLIVEHASAMRGTQKVEFDGMWLSSLTDSTAKGKPDIEVVDRTSRSNTIGEIVEVTTKPIIFDGDTGGMTEHFPYLVRTLERLGVSAVIIEDKVGLKKNSLFGTEVQQTQDSIENFCSKIRAGIEAKIHQDFMVFARIESLILEAGMDDAMRRAEAYIDAGVDGIMIHSRHKNGKEIEEFCGRYAKLKNRMPLVAVPTSYNHLTESDLQKLGFRIVIYANHLIRSAYPAMYKTAETILEHGRSMEVDQQCMSISDILNLIPGGK
jgi:phosphoenolpyruvate phosphomutase